MTYCPWIEHVILKTGGMVSFVKLLSLKHRVACNKSGVEETYSENPKKESASKNLNPGKKRYMYDINCNRSPRLKFIICSTITYILWILRTSFYEQSIKFYLKGMKTTKRREISGHKRSKEKNRSI